MGIQMHYFRRKPKLHCLDRSTVKNERRIII